MNESGVSKGGFEDRLYQMIVTLDKKKLEEMINDLEKKLRDLIILKKMLYCLTEEKINFSLKVVKEEINIIENQKDYLNEEVFKSALNTFNDIEKNLEYSLKSEIDKNQKLIQSWEKINKAFNYKNISKTELPNFRKKFLDLMKIGALLKSSDDISKTMITCKTNLDNYLKKKQEFNEKILDYLKNFSDKKFVEDLTQGKDLQIKDLNPEMYKKIYKSVLKDKISIKLK